jgi:cation-transporting ATPase 13A3/4/5
MTLPIRVLEYPFPVATVFPSKVATVPGQVLLKPSPDDYDEFKGMLKQLLIVDYRYTRLAVDPRTGLFSLVR